VALWRCFAATRAALFSAFLPGCLVRNWRHFTVLRNFGGTHPAARRHIAEDHRTVPNPKMTPLPQPHRTAVHKVGLSVTPSSIVTSSCSFYSVRTLFTHCFISCCNFLLCFRQSSVKSTRSMSWRLDWVTDGSIGQSSSLETDSGSADEYNSRLVVAEVFYDCLSGQW